MTKFICVYLFYAYFIYTIYKNMYKLYIIELKNEIGACKEDP